MPTFGGGTSLGIFWIDVFFKPAAKEIMKSPELVFLMLVIVYGSIAWRCWKSVYDENALN